MIFKVLKGIDVIIQLFLIIFLGITTKREENFMENLFYPAYFFIGIYQLLSWFVQLPLGYYRKPGMLRVLYQRMLLVLLLAIIVMILFPIAESYFIVWSVVCPSMAIFYCSLSIHETLKLIRYEK